MAAGVEIIVVARHRFQPVEVIRHGLAGELAGPWLGRAGVDGIGRMGYDGAEMMVPHPGTEGRSIRRVKGLGPAAPGISCEKLKGVRVDGRRSLPHGEEARRGREMTAKICHSIAS